MSASSNPKKDAAARARAALAAISDEEDRAITENARADPDNPPADQLVARRGRPPVENPKAQVTLRLDPDVVSFFRAKGRGWQTAVNEALRKAAGLK